MYFFFSGEGPTDLGTSNDQPGPLALIADQIITEHHHYSFLESGYAVFVHPAELGRIKGLPDFKPLSRKSIRLPSPNVKPETRFHYDDARAFSRAAKDALENKNESNAEFVAVLFRDSNSPDEKVWSDKRNSMLRGFHVENIEKHGVAAVARPISEAWWLCAIYHREETDKDRKHFESTNHVIGTETDLKRKLETELGTTPNRTVLNEMVTNREIDYKLIDSESFLAFRRDFETAVGLEHLYYTKATP